MKKFWMLVVMAVFAAALAMTEPGFAASESGEPGGTMPEINAQSTSASARAQSSTTKVMSDKLDLNTATADQTQDPDRHW